MIKLNYFRRTAFLIIFFLVPAIAVFSQKKYPNMSLGKKGMTVKHIDFYSMPDSAPIFHQGAIILYLDSNNKMMGHPTKLISKDLGENGYTQYKWQQTIKGVEIENAIIIQHVQKNHVMSQFGEWLIDTASLIMQKPSITKKGAVDISLKTIGGSQYDWEIKSEEDLLKTTTGNPSATYYPNPDLIYYGGEEAIDPAKIRLAYRVTVFSRVPFKRQTLIIDASTGAVLATRNLIADADVASNVNTAYSGTKSILTNQLSSNQYILSETTKGKGIAVRNLSGKGKNFASATNFTNNSTNWTAFNPAVDQYATDAMWGQEKTYDFYKSNFGRNSVDNMGFALNGYVHADLIGAFDYQNNINAFWDGVEMVYGDGNGSSITPLTCLDVVGHEITHGVTSNSAKLTYQKESGALNEGFSDVMGTSIEFYGKPSQANWTIGENTGLIFRSMADPKLYNQPNTYHGTYWQNTECGTPSSANDYCGVHTNSGVLNYWYYLLVNGGSGTNDINNQYTVSGIGLATAQKIAYNTLLSLASNSQYADARTQSISYASGQYGVNSSQVIAVTNAWYAVGVGGVYVSVVGPSSFCTNGTYTLNGVSSGSNVSWSISPANSNVTLSPSGNQVYISYYTPNQISFTLKGTFNGSSGSLPVTANSNYLSGTYSNGSTNGTLNTFNYVPAGYTNGYFNWPNVSNISVTGSGSGSSFYWNGGNSFSFYLSGGQNMSVYFTGTSSCGSGGPVAVNATRTFQASSSFAITASPNPTSGSLSLAITSVPDTTGKIMKSQMAAALSSPELSSTNATKILLYDLSTGILVRKWAYSENISTNYKLNVSGLKPGNYVLKMSRNNQTTSLNILVQ